MTLREWLTARGRWIAAVIAVLTGLFANPTPVVGSTVVPMTIDALANYAGQVILGRVTSVRSYWAESPRRIETEVAFAEVEYLKGWLPDAGLTFTLIVPGGTVDGYTLRLAEAPTLAPGEKWLLFLLPEYKTYPVVGIAQGAFRIDADPAGVERVGDAVRRTIAGVDPQGLIQTLQPTRNVTAAPVRANHLRIKTTAGGAPNTPSMTLADFRAYLQPILERSRDHALRVPAGRPVKVRHQPVPLRLADRAVRSVGDCGRLSTARQAVPAGKPTGSRSGSKTSESAVRRAAR